VCDRSPRSCPGDCSVKESQPDEPVPTPTESGPFTWWVNQGQTYAKERDGSYIWAPQKTKSGTPASHHTAVADVRRGDRIVHYAKGHIRAAGIAVSDGREARRPDELSGEAWEVDGYSAQVQYHELERPIPLAEIDMSYREGGGGPFTAAGAVQQGYLFRVSEDVGQYLAELVDQGEQQSPKLWVVYVGQASVTNLRHSLPTGMWGWRHEQANYGEFAPGDTVLFSVGYTGGSPRTGLDEFRAERFDELVICRVKSALRTESSAYWPDETDSVVYPFRIDISQVEVVSDVAISDLDAQYGGPVANSFRLSAISQSRAVLVEGAPGPDLGGSSRRKEAEVTPTGYVEVVEKFAAASKASGLDYGVRHDQLIGSFVTALATKPFAILTGLSGSGKTRLALAFGQWLGDEAVRIIPVRPDWTSPDSLLGYEDALAESSPDGRLRWIVPQALEFMLRAANNPERPYLLVLDEMNLAHVERYFADVLSGMESGQGVLPNLVLEDEGQYRERTDSTGPLPLPDNLFIVGTVNVDETTYMFSPKVLDRANSFEFRVGTGDLGTTGVLRDLEPTSAEDAAGFLRAARTTPEPSTDDEAFEQAVRSLHGLLSEYDREFGHRTYQESIRFARRFRELDPDPLVALDLQVIQKVLPRLHGSRRELTDVLNQLGRWCFYGPSESRDPFDAAEQQPVGAVLPESYSKLHRMAKRLRDRHFASFAE
jgi:MoxR-like ATPase